MNFGKLFIGYDFVAALALFYIIDDENVFFLAIIAAAIHELGHIVAIKCCGAKIEKVYLCIYGAQIRMKRYPIISYKREIIIALAGPTAGAILGALSSLMGNNTLAGFSLILTAFNLLPALPLDGGRVVESAGLLFFDEEFQKRISKVCCILSAVFMVALCVYICTKYGVSPSMCIFCTFSASNFLKELFK